MKFSRFWTVILFFLICFNLNCSTLFSEKEVSKRKIERIHKQIKNNDWKKIYDESSSALKSRMSEQEFMNLMDNAAGKMKSIDESLNFQESEIGFVLSGMNIDYKYSIKTEKLEKNGNRVELISHWNKNGSNDEFRLVSLAIVRKSESGEFENFYI